MKYILFALIGGLAAMMANQGVAVFNDGFRPFVGQYFNKQISRKVLATMSFAISFGLVIGFGIPTSLAGNVILAHSVLLATDIIGTVFPDDKKGLVLSGIVGAAYGALLIFGLQAIVDLFAKLPYDFTQQLGSISTYIVGAFAIFPAVAVGLQHGFKKGMISGGLTVLTFFLIKKFGTFAVKDATISLSAEGMSMLVGMITLIYFAASQKSEEKSSATSDLASSFSQNVSRIRKNVVPMAILGGLLSIAASEALLAGDPTSLSLIAEGKAFEASITAFARAIGFIPLVFTTSIVTGVYGSAGITMIYAAAFLLQGKPIVAFIVGALIIVLEVFLINAFAKLMDKFPGVKEMGEHIRTSMNRVLEIAMLAGSILAAEAMSSTAAGFGGIGALFVIGSYLLNKQSKKPIVDVAVGPVAAIIFGIILNILLVIGLITLPVAA